MVAFLELTKQVHIIKDMILSDMVCEDDHVADAAAFSMHIYCTKFWFLRMSWANKKRFLLTLIDDIQSSHAISIILKSIWNSRTKDAMLSFSTLKSLCSYDQVPMDNNRTALPLSVLVQVMKSDRKWFVALESESQSAVILELLTISGGPLVWEVLKRAQRSYDQHWQRQTSYNKQFSSLAVPLEEHATGDGSRGGGASKKGKKGNVERKTSKLSANRSSNLIQSTSKLSKLGKVSKLDAVGPSKSPAALELESRLATWEQLVQSMRTKLQMVEVKMAASDGSPKTIWKVNRPKHEAAETLDFIQLLPAWIGKYIVSFLPKEHYPDYAKVNKYWAYLIEELKAETTVKEKIQLEIEKFNEVLMQYDTSMELLTQIETIPEHHFDQHSSAPQSLAFGSTVKRFHRQPAPPSTKLSEKSTNYSLRHFVMDEQKRENVKPVPNLTELTERLERRGAADEGVFQWCEQILRRGHDVPHKANLVKPVGGVIDTGLEHFPCPLLLKTLQIPLDPPLYKDPVISYYEKSRHNISSSNLMHTPRIQSDKRYKLWSRDFTGLYPVSKIPSHDVRF